MSGDGEQKEIIEFPTRFPVKAMGKTEDSFVEHVVSLVQPLIDDFENAEVESRDSNGGKFRSVTITFTARSRDQLDDVYRALTGDDRILYVL